MDIIETDVQITKDGKIIICHDSSWDRLCEPHTINNKTVRETDSD